MRQRRRYRVRGVVQGVGFRPFVSQLAQQLGLGGHVGNDGEGVFIEAEGEPGALDQFERALHTQSPPLAQITDIKSELVLTLDECTFRIVESRAESRATTLVPADVSVCDACLRELFDPSDRRHRYPFINCTNCGPRFTIIRALPYDRPLTTMAAFAMCERCAEEYVDPSNRRFHAQPIACPSCGPHLWFEEGELQWEGEAALQRAQAALLQGQIIAVKGLGGFHLACDARSEAAVQTLRRRKKRPAKPFALMVRDLTVLRQLVDVSPSAEAVLRSRERPIVLLPRRQDAPIAESVAPSNAVLGVMLPYTPLHYLLLDGDLSEVPLVMTSGNRSDEPIAKDNAEAQARLSDIADGFLLHNRPIYARCDDSVVRLFRSAPLPIRRSRGYVPLPIVLSEPLPEVLAVGGELKATFCLTRGEHAYLSQHVGDVENVETLQAFEEALEHFIQLFGIQPRCVTCDLHPAYHTTRWARAWASARELPLIAVQHHHAHIVACLAEHRRNLRQPVIGVSFDGTGYGADGTIWGGEVLIADGVRFERAAHLAEVPLPGGDVSVRRPYRMALAHLWAAGLPWEADLPCVQACPPVEQRILAQQLARGVQCVRTSSAGRLFDAIASLMGVCHQADYEGQAAIELEGIAQQGGCAEAYPFAIREGQPIQIEVAPMLSAILSDVRGGVPLPLVAARFHTTLAQALAVVCMRLRATRGLNVVALSGGVFQNLVLTEQVVASLEAEGFEVLVHRQVPPNDGGLALGQAASAAMQLAARSLHVP
ncbi:MAG: carbamoyltransferase HypF [Anaerolineae bacterium]|nr:carbamoyltransferase HypF [Anaerolineae bacterium]